MKLAQQFQIINLFILLIRIRGVIGEIEVRDSIPGK